MKIYDETKTVELNEAEIDFTKGYLVRDKLFVAHHDAQPLVAGKTAAEIAEELKAEGKEVTGINGNFFLISYDNGKRTVTRITGTPSVPAKDAWDEYKDIKVYVPYTVEELKEQLRSERVPLLMAFDKWEKAVLRGRERDDYAIMAWFQDLLDLKEIAFDNVPVRIQYYTIKN